MEVKAELIVALNDSIRLFVQNFVLKIGTILFGSVQTMHLPYEVG
jgi:hypothetical protein